MATSGLVSAIHSLDFSKPEKTRFQYGSSVCLLSIAAPIAGTCEEATPAMILATLRPLSALLGFGLGGFGFGGTGSGGLALEGFRLGARQPRGRALARLAAIAFDRAA